MTVRKCPACGRDVIGRSDKRFCSDECRIFYNNALRRRKRSRNRRQIRAIVSNIRQMDEAGAKNLLRLLERISKVFKIMSTFAKPREKRQ
jgi:predicted nucleic acid-binding Zn ribbon protein